MKLNKSMPTILMALTLAVGCGEKSEGTKVVEDGHSQVCPHGFNSGKSLSDVASLGESTGTALFGKEYNENALSIVADLSGAETVNYIENYLNTSVFKSDDTVDSEKDCMSEGQGYFASLSDTPISSKWESITGGVSGTLLGLYLPKTDSDNPTGKPLITVTPGTGRGTLIHEMMHHLFYHHNTEVAKNLDGEALIDKHNELANKVNDEWADVEDGKGDIDKAVDYLYEYTQVRRDVSIRYGLEEVTIERKLIELIDNGQLQYIENNYKKGAVWYIKSKADSEGDTFRKLATKINDLTNDHFSKLSTAKREKMDEAYEIARNLRDQADEQYYWALDNAAKYSAKGESGLMDDHVHKDCNHTTPASVEEATNAFLD